jgi:hypothetical protein
MNKGLRITIFILFAPISVALKRPIDLWVCYQLGRFRGFLGSFGFLENTVKKERKDG